MGSFYRKLWCFASIPNWVIRMLRLDSELVCR